MSVFGSDRLESAPLAALSADRKLYKVRADDLFELEAQSAKKLKYFAVIRPGGPRTEMCRSITIKSGVLEDSYVVIQ